ncbi:hypothetical protein Tco_1056529 [Tanacetum coccineum]|uniref:Uncharacterized protein n=1 Tax=Tanacetum coccineum TaxID=301880 RepID=A0ABQ5H2T5_9ASTR
MLPEIRILQVLNKMEEKFEEIIRDGRKKIEDMSIEEVMHEQQIEVRKKEKAYEDEKYAAACRYMLSITCDDEDDYIPSGDIIARYSTSITPDLPIEESENSLIMGDEPLSTIPATESDEVIKSSVENLVPIPSEFEGISDDTSDVPTCDNNCVNVESDLLESLINRDTSIVYSSKIDPILEEFADELAHLAPISPEIVEACVDDDDTDDDVDFYDCIDIEEDGGEIDLDISKIVDISLREKLVESYLLIEKINTFNLSPPIPISPIFLPPSTFPVVDLDLPLRGGGCAIGFPDLKLHVKVIVERTKQFPHISIDGLQSSLHTWENSILKGLQRQKEAKTIKNRQGTKETRARVKKQPKIQPEHPTQQERQSKEEIIKSRAKSDKL